MKMSININKVRILSRLKWLGFPLGYLMYFGTVNSFPIGISLILSIVATVAFWLLIRREEVNYMGRFIAKDVSTAISDVGQYPNIIEIKRLSAGLVVRVYLVQAKEKLPVIQRSIENILRHNVFGNRILFIQMTDMQDRSFLKSHQEALNMELLNTLKKYKDGKGKNK